MTPAQNMDMAACIHACWECRHECQTTLFNHCLPMGGAHADVEHVKLMVDCIDLCQLAADLMVRNSRHHAETCAACAAACEECAQSCQDIGGDVMLRCAELCRACATSCQTSSQMARAA